MTQNYIPSMLDGWHPGMSESGSRFGASGGGGYIGGVGGGSGYVVIRYQQPEDKDNDMAFTNPQAAEIAREILDEKTKGELRSTVEVAVTELAALIEGTACGSTLTFVKHNEKGEHYYYAAVKNDGKWYTTAQNPRVIADDDALIEWLIGLEIYSAPQLELKASAFPETHAIEVTASET